MTSKVKTTKGAPVAAPAEEEKADVGSLSKDGQAVAGTAPAAPKTKAAKEPAKETPKAFVPVATFSSPLKAFAAALAPLGRAAGQAKSTYPITANVLLSLKGNQLTLVTTNMELTIVETIDVTVAPVEGVDPAMAPKDPEAVEVTLPYRLLAELVGMMAGETVAISFSEDRAVVKCGSSSTELNGINAKDFPGVEKTAKDLKFFFSAGDFKQAAKQVEFAASADESRPALQGVQLIPALDATKDVIGLTLAATDGFRVSVKTLGFSEPPEGKVDTFSAIIPASALAEVGRLITDPDSFVAFGVKGGKAMFSYGNLLISTLLIDGKFPDVNQILPRGYKTHMVVATSALAKAVKQAEVIAKTGNNVVRLTLDASGSPDNLVLFAESAEMGEINGTLATTIEGPGLTIAFNVRFLKEALESIDSPQVALDTNDHKSPARLKGVGDDTHFVVIMPMHLG